jgi:hypothetical protein
MDYGKEVLSHKAGVKHLNMRDSKTGGNKHYPEGHYIRRPLQVRIVSVTINERLSLTISGHKDLPASSISNASAGIAGSDGTRQVTYFEKEARMLIMGSPNVLGCSSCPQLI